MTNNSGVEAILPLTPTQRGMVFHTVYDPASRAYFNQMAFTVRQAWRPELLAQRWQRATDRHAVLRTSFHWEDLNKPVQVVHREVRAQCRHVDLSTLEGAEQSAAFARFAQEERAQGFDLSHAPLARLTLFSLKSGEQRLLLSYHHSVLETWSIALLFEELFFDALPPPPRPFSDFVAWLTRRDPAAWRTHWSKRLAGFTGEVPLALDLAPGRISVEAQKEMTVRLTTEETETLRRTAQAQQVTLATMVHAAWGWLLTNYSRTDDVLFGSTHSGRNAPLEGIERMVGLFINTVPCRLKLGDFTVQSWLHHVQSVLSQDREQGDASLAEIQSAAGLPSDGPLFDSLVVVENVPLGQALGKTQRELGFKDFWQNEDSAYPLTWVVHPTDALEILLAYQPSHFSDASAQLLAQSLVEVLRAIPTLLLKSVRTLPTMPPSIRHQLLEEWSQTGPTQPRPGIDVAIEEQVQRTPQATAIRVGAQSLTYRQLWDRTLALARRLVEAGVSGTEPRVAVVLPPGMDAIIAFLAVWRAGAAYVPLDPEGPPERLDLCLRDSQARWVVTLPSQANRFGQQRVIFANDLDGATLDNAVGIPRSTGRLAYIVYTSGSTGLPKGVAVSHANLANHSISVSDAFRLLPSDAILQFTPLSFDAAGEEIYPALLRGSTIVVSEQELTPATMGPFVEEMGLTVLSLPPAFGVSWLNHLTETGGRVPESLRLVLFGGEKLVPELFSLWDGLGGKNVRWINVYGPTEGTITTALFEVDRSRPFRTPSLPIGRPIANARVFLLDDHGSPCPPGVPGELFIGGAGVARGYWGQPALTAERFVPSPFSNAAGERLYRTGDLARFDSSGLLEFLGRTDQQIKIRGFRVEPGEIESALRAHPAVAEAVVTAQKQPDTQIWAYVVARSSVSTSDLRAFLKGRLPPYMLPAEIILLDALPLTSNGKVDLRALPTQATPRLSSEAQTLPRTHYEQVVAQAWAKALRLPVVGLDQDLFDLGAHSLIAMQVIGQLRTMFHAEVSVRQLMEGPTVREQAARIHATKLRSAGVGATVLTRRPDHEPAPLSFGQERLWFIDQLERNSNAYTIPMALTFRGKLDIDALRASLETLVMRHEALRTTFEPSDQGMQQRIQPPSPWVLPVEDCDASELAERCRREGKTHLDLKTGPLFRTTLLRCTSTEHVLLFTMHHAIADGWSLAVLFRDLRSLYREQTGLEPSGLPSLPLRYRDYAAWQRQWLKSSQLEGQLSYWRNKLAGGQPALELPFDAPPSEKPTYLRGKKVHWVSPQRQAALSALCEKESVTPFMILLSAFKALLFRYSGTEDLLVGTDVATRDQGELQDVVGYLLNQLVLRTHAQDKAPFRTFLKKVRETVLEALEHQDLPFEELVKAWNPERTPYHHGPVQVRLLYQSFPAPDSKVTPDLEAQADEVESTAAPFLLSFVFDRLDAGLRLTVNYQQDRFRSETMDRFIQHFFTLLDGALAAPQTPLGMLPLLSDAEREQSLWGWNKTAAPLTDARTLHAWVERQVLKTPESIAVRSGNAQWTYRELYAKAQALARQLQKSGIGPESRVGLLLSPSADSIACALGVLMSGAAYLPVDPAAPRERKQKILADGHVQVLLQHPAHEEDTRGLAMPRWTLHSAFWAELPSSGELRSEAQPENLAYIIYTSGSTGEPKGVSVPHRAILNHNQAVSHAFELQPSDRILQFSPLHFDAAAEEIYPVLGTGGSLVIRDDLVSPGEFNALIEAEGLTVLSLPPAFLHEWVMHLERTKASVPRGLRLVLVGGEKIRPESLSLWKACGGGHVPWINVYGPTECTITSALCKLSAQSDPLTQAMLPIGKPIANGRIYLLTSEGQPVPLNVPGEIFIGGLGVARGYVDRPDETADRFLPDPFSPTAGARMYKTGDLGRRHPDGTIEFCGRADRQIKIRAFRIELGEVESALRKHPSLQDAVVTGALDAQGQQRLVAYYVLKPEAFASPSQLRTHAAITLPDYMVPSAFEPLPALPTTSTGKINFAALPPPRWEQSLSRQPPRTPMELKMVQLFEELLEIRGVGVEQSFFELGGHSLLALRLADRTFEDMGIELPLTTLFDTPTPQALAAALETQSENTMAPGPALMLAQHGTGRPWFLIHSATGLATEYFALAQQLGTERPICALGASGLRANEPIVTQLTEMARNYLAAVRKIQPRGPYALAGYSVGGLIAFEMACQLEAEGEAVEPLVLLDAWTPELSKSVDNVTGSGTGVPSESPLVRLSRFFGATLPSEGESAGWEHVTDMARTRGWLPPHAQSADLQRLAQVFLACSDAADAYQPGRFGGRLNVLRSEESSTQQGDPTLGWGSVARGEITVHFVPGQHRELLAAPAVDRVAKILSALMPGAQ